MDQSLTTREQFLQHSEDSACSGCHRMMDPIGFGFEHFDGMGRYRETEWGLAIDASGEVYDAGDASGTFNGVAELAQRLSRSQHVRDCVATQWFRFAFGRTEGTEDECSLETMRRGFADGSYDIKDLLIAITQTDAFRYRRNVEVTP